MGNIYTVENKSTLLVNKLKGLIVSVQSLSSPQGTQVYQTYDEVAAKLYEQISSYYKGLDKPIFTPINVLYRTDPEPVDFNKRFSDIALDFNVIYSEFENVEDILLSSFNYMVSRINRLNARLKQVASMATNYTFYNSSIKNSIWFSDSFTNLEKIESRSPLLKEADELTVSQEEGIITLPIDSTSNPKLNLSSVPVINANSNGIIGNNYQYSTTKNSDITKVLDYNSDTWFEYERVSSKDDGVAIVLDLTISLAKPEIINFIRINPNNFGTKTQLEVLSLKVSTDGKTYDDIQDDLLAPDLVDAETKTLLIAPSTSKYAGQGLYSFIPKKAKFVRIALRQTTPYIITNYVTGKNNYRYAIGIRDIHIEKRKYKDKGEIISKAFTLSNQDDPVRKLVIETEQSPTPLEIDSLGNFVLGRLSHTISPDNGTTWNQVRPKVGSGTEGTIDQVPEILDFNGVDTNAVTTSAPVTSLRYRLVMERNNEAFTSENSSLGATEVLTTEMHQCPSSSPYSITLNNNPIDKTVSVVESLLGSRGIDTMKYSVSAGKGGSKKIYLPWKQIPADIGRPFNAPQGVWESTDVNPLKVLVDGVEWTRAKLVGDNPYYQANLETGIIQFGDGTNGRAVHDGANIEVYLTEERVFPSSDSSHTFTTAFPIARDTEGIEIYSVSPLKHKTAILKRGARTHKLDMYIDEDTIIVPSDTVVFHTNTTFIDGASELTSTGYWSIDYENGIVYSYDKTNEATDTTITYAYRPRKKLDSSDYSFTDDGQISIHDNAWETFPSEPDIGYYFPYAKKYTATRYFAIVEGSMVFSGGDAATIFQVEVPFVDGRTELLPVKRTIQQLSSISSVGLNSLNLSMQISSLSGLETIFSNTDVFATQQSALVDVTSDGDYYIDKTAGSPKVYVYADATVTNPGSITYYYDTPNRSLTGYYSINYKTGEVYTYNAPTSGLDRMEYRYSDYRVRYPIARAIANADFTVNVSSKQVTISDREILKKKSVQRNDTNDLGYYRISYKYLSTPEADLDEYKDFYTPVLASYKIRAITQSKMAI